MQKGSHGIELWAKILVEPELQVLLAVRHQACLLQMLLGRCDFTIQYMSMYSVTCSKLLLINGGFIWDMSYLAHIWSTHSKMTGAALEVRRRWLWSAFLTVKVPILKAASISTEL